jgi:hypothetical protein
MGIEACFDAGANADLLCEDGICGYTFFVNELLNLGETETISF